MYLWLLIAHREWRWIVLLAGFVAVAGAALRLWRGQPWASAGPVLMKCFSVAVDIQVLLGAALYLLVSPLTTVAASNTEVALPVGSEARFFALIHPLIMVAALILVHLTAVLARRGASDRSRQWRSIVLASITLLIIAAGIPWWRLRG
jgi:hypothetical protein